MKHSTNAMMAGSSLYEESQVKNSNNLKNESKPKNILAAIDLNKNYYEKKRPYSAHKVIYHDNNIQSITSNSNAANLNLNNNKPRSAKSKIKNYDNSDLRNHQHQNNVNADYYQERSILKI